MQTFFFIVLPFMFQQILERSDRHQILNYYLTGGFVFYQYFYTIGLLYYLQFYIYQSFCIRKDFLIRIFKNQFGIFRTLQFWLTSLFLILSIIHFYLLKITKLSLDLKTLKMQVQTDFSNQYPLKLNCSSIASSTPGNNFSFPQSQLIKFEQFQKQISVNKQKPVNSNICHKKRLTIQINDSYDFNTSNDNSQLIHQQMQSSLPEPHVNFFKKQQMQDRSYQVGQSQSPSFATSSHQSQFKRIIDLNISLSQKNQFLNQKVQEFNELLANQKNINRHIKNQYQNLKMAIKKKDQLIHNQKEKNNSLLKRINQLEQLSNTNKLYQQTIKEKDIKIQEYQRKLQKVTIMNKAFRKQLSQSDKKILQLQRDLQKTFCQNQHDTINRIKQSSVRIKQPSLKSKQLIMAKQTLVGRQSKQSIAKQTKEPGTKQMKQSITKEMKQSITKEIKQSITKEMKECMGNKQNQNTLGNQNILGNTIQRKSLDKKKCSQSQGKKKTIIQPMMKGQRTSSTSNIVNKKLLHLKKQ